jgi:shikimate kinase
MMGVGKSSIGWRLAKRMGVPFFDSDQEVERSAGCSVSDICTLWGKGAFVDVERKIIRRLLTGSGYVLSTGDGSFIQDDLRQEMLASALCVWLRADLETIYRRVRYRKTRPQLLVGDSQATLKRLLEERNDTYAQAHLVVESQDEAHDKTVDRVLEKIHTYMEQPLT